MGDQAIPWIKGGLFARLLAPGRVDALAGDPDVCDGVVRRIRLLRHAAPARRGRAHDVLDRAALTKQVRRRAPVRNIQVTGRVLLRRESNSCRLRMQQEIANTTEASRDGLPATPRESRIPRRRTPPRGLD